MTKLEAIQERLSNISAKATHARSFKERNGEEYNPSLPAEYLEGEAQGLQHALSIMRNPRYT